MKTRLFVLLIGILLLILAYPAPLSRATAVLPVSGSIHSAYVANLDGDIEIVTIDASNGDVINQHDLPTVNGLNGFVTVMDSGVYRQPGYINDGTKRAGLNIHPLTGDVLTSTLSYDVRFIEAYSETVYVVMENHIGLIDESWNVLDSQPHTYTMFLSGVSTADNDSGHMYFVGGEYNIGTRAIVQVDLSTLTIINQALFDYSLVHMAWTDEGLVGLVLTNLGSGVFSAEVVKINHLTGEYTPIASIYGGSILWQGAAASNGPLYMFQARYGGADRLVKVEVATGLVDDSTIINIPERLRSSAGVSLAGFEFDDTITKKLYLAVIAKNGW